MDSRHTTKKDTWVAKTKRKYISLVIRGMQIKATMGYCHIKFGMAKIKKLKT